MLHTPSATRGMVTSPHHLASQSGLDILKAGGNAVEACVATAATLAVVYPHMTGIGGDGFWLVREPDGTLYSINACGSAGQKVDRVLYAEAGHDTIPWRGPLAAITTAGTVSGWQSALERTGQTLPLADLLREAIHYAETGVVVTKGGAEIARSKDDELKDVFGYADIFRPNKRPLQEGDLLKQPRLAETLHRLAENGLADFYRGALAADIVRDLAAAGSPLSMEDLEAHEADLLTPLQTQIRGAKLYNTAPPTQGLVSLLILALFDRLDADSVDSFEHVHGLVEATKQAFLLYKKIGLGDRAFMKADPQAILDDEEQLARLAEAISPDTALPWPHIGELGDTTWFGAADNEGRMVSCIQSTYFEFGSGIVLPTTGITWQNRGASFTLAENGWNTLAPGRKPFHTLNPALAELEDGRVLAYGTMGGEGQPQTQAAIFTRHVRFGVPLQEAVSTPRWLLGRTWGDNSVTLKLEDRFSPQLYELLRAAGHEVEVCPAFTSMMGHAGAISRHADGRLEGASDPRSDGGVAAW